MLDFTKGLAEVALSKDEAKVAQQVEESVGYVVLSNKLTKVPVFGAGGGYGIAVDNEKDEEIYLKKRRLDFGAGWGVRSYTLVLVFTDREKFDDFTDGKWMLRLGAETAAKVGDIGGAANADASELAAAKARGYHHYMMTGAGVSATFTSAVIRVSPVKL